MRSMVDLRLWSRSKPLIRWRWLSFSATSPYSTNDSCSAKLTVTERRRHQQAETGTQQDREDSEDAGTTYRLYIYTYYNRIKQQRHRHLHQCRVGIVYQFCSENKLFFCHNAETFSDYYEYHLRARQLHPQPRNAHIHGISKIRMGGNNCFARRTTTTLYPPRKLRTTFHKKH